MQSTGSTPDSPVTGFSALMATTGLVLALFGVYWDDSWHTDKGRDSLMSAPHLALYIGVGVAVSVTAFWGWRSRGDGRQESVSGPVAMAIVGAVVTLGSAPVDEWWHSTFGRDAVLWSPPHLLAVIGTLALGTGIVLVIAAGIDGLSRRLGLGLLVVSGATVIGGWQVLVLEYDTDVAQFSAFWYLPVLAGALMAAALTVQAAVRVRHAVIWAGAAYTATMALVAALLWAMGFSTPIIPAVLPALIAADFLSRRRRRVVERAGAFYLVLLVVYLPYLNVVPGGVAPSLTEALVGTALGVPVVTVVILLFDPAAKLTRSSLATVAVVSLVAGVVLVGITARPLAAHDPGQGPDVLTIVLMVELDGSTVEVRAVGVLADFEPVRLVARRAGRVIEGLLSVSGANWAGTVDVDENGRWFVYVEGRRGNDAVEAWIPVVIGDDVHASRRTSLYLVPGTDGTSRSQVVIGALLASLSLLIMARVVLTVRFVAGRDTQPERLESA